jgi:hypothetical protein
MTKDMPKAKVVIKAIKRAIIMPITSIILMKRSQEPHVAAVQFRGYKALH